MRVLGLCATASKAAQLDAEIAELPSVRASYVVARPDTVSRTRFLIGQVWRLLTGGRRKATRVLRLSRERRLFFTWRALQDPQTLKEIAAIHPDVGLHATGVIYRAPILACFRIGILNPHIGLLPRYRGRSVMEWSILEGRPTGITTFIIDEGIDTGAIVLRRHVPIAPARTVAHAKDALFRLDGAMFTEALRVLSQPAFEPQPQAADDGRRYYVMSRLFVGVVTRLLERPRATEPASMSQPVRAEVPEK